MGESTFKVSRCDKWPGEVSWLGAAIQQNGLRFIAELVRLCWLVHSKVHHLDQVVEEHAQSIQSGLGLHAQNTSASGSWLDNAISRIGTRGSM
jgi:hypothetical protein